jgi:hypothetical protein
MAHGNIISRRRRIINVKKMDIAACGLTTDRDSLGACCFRIYQENRESQARGGSVTVSGRWIQDRPG